MEGFNPQMGRSVCDMRIWGLCLVVIYGFLWHRMLFKVYCAKGCDGCSEWSYMSLEEDKWGFKFPAVSVPLTGILLAWSCPFDFQTNNPLLCSFVSASSSDCEWHSAVKYGLSETFWLLGLTYSVLGSFWRRGGEDTVIMILMMLCLLTTWQSSCQAAVMQWILNRSISLVCLSICLQLVLDARHE